MCIVTYNTQKQSDDFLVTRENRDCELIDQNQFKENLMILKSEEARKIFERLWSREGRRKEKLSLDSV